jgi:hypothetical protein
VDLEVVKPESAQLGMVRSGSLKVGVMEVRVVEVVKLGGEIWSEGDESFRIGIGGVRRGKVRSSECSGSCEFMEIWVRKPLTIIVLVFAIQMGIVSTQAIEIVALSIGV